MSPSAPASTIAGFPTLAQAESLMEAGKLEAAAQLAMQHLRKMPNEPRGLALLGTAAMQLGALGQAEMFLRRAIANGAQDFDTRRHLASTLNLQEKLEEARVMIGALRQESSDPYLSGVLSVVLDKMGRTVEAMKIRAEIVEQHPEQPHHWIAYGHSLRAAGQVDEAIKAYRTAVVADFECGEAWWGLASIKRPVLTDADIADMQRAINVAIDIRNSAPTHFALARAFHDRAQYGDAFEHYRIGNQQRAESIGYMPEELTAEVNEVETRVDAAFIEKIIRPAGDAVAPIFIVCLPRSGSTLLEQMLGSHPQIEPVGELPYIPAILRSVMEMATRKGKVTVPQLIAGLTDEQAAVMGQDYLRRAALHRKTDRPFFIDKLPHNWSNILFIRRILPQARFIDIRRPPMDCCFSNFSQSFSTAHASSFALEDIGQCYVDYVRYMDHLASVAPNMIHPIAYTRLVEDAENELRSALSYLNLPWNPAVLEFHKLDRVVRTPSSEQVRRPLNRDGIDAWMPYAEWLEPLRNTLGALAEPEWSRR